MNDEKIEKLTNTEFDNLFIKIHEKITENPITNFLEAKGFINIILTPGQRVLFKLVMNVPLDYDTKYQVYLEDNTAEEFKLMEDYMTEVELYEFYTQKDYDPTKIEIIRDVTLLIGRRGSKTTIASILAVWVALKKNWKYQLGRKKVATIPVMSHTKEFSDEIIEEVRAIIEGSAILQRLVNKKAKNTQSTINLKIPFKDDNGKITYSFVRIRTSAASSKSTRGGACPCIICDEIGFWGAGPDSKETDKEIVRAAKPSLLQFGDDAMWIELSTPNTKQGVLYEKYENRFNLSPKQVILISPSWVFNNRYRAEDYFDFWKDDPDNFDREFRANFIDSTGSFFTMEAIEKCVMKNVKAMPPALKKEKVKYSCAIDSAFKGDVFAISVVGAHEFRYKQYAALGFKGSRLRPVKAFEVAEAVSGLNNTFDFDGKVSGDQYSYQPLREIFATFNLTLIERVFTQTFKHKIYKNLKYVIDNNQIDLLDHQETIKELKQLQVEISTTGKIKIMHPPGGHDDYSDALAIAVYIAKEQNGAFESDFDTPGKDYEIPTDINGISFKAPAPEMLTREFGDVMDNSHEYEIDPETKKLKKIKDLDEDDEDDGFQFCI